jgi:thiamine-phosphate pyrophosphorylase
MAALPRLYAIADTALLDRVGMDPVAAAGALFDAGVRLLQLRHKKHFSYELFLKARKIGQMAEDAGARFVINDRADIAMLLGAGLHLGQSDLPPARARQLLGPQGWIGYSTHNEEQLQAADAEPVDYLAIGPIFETASKENPDPVIGLERLATLRSLTKKPLVAIGGITRLSAPAVLERGVDCVAVIRDLFPQPCSRQAIREAASHWLRVLRDMV